ncbi:MAG: GMC oxidoreductase [Candidatus Rokuibacteriota bacterium]
MVGSGASGVHFALSVLRKRYEVVMVDVARTPPGMSEAESFTDLKTRLDDPVRFFLGERYEGVVLPQTTGEYYGFPPNQTYVFEPPPEFQFRARGFAPLFSFAQGGLAQTWTGGVYPLNDDELRDLPFRYEDLKPYYDEVAARIGVSGAMDDLAPYFPRHDHLAEPLRLDRHGQLLITEYEKRREEFATRLRCRLGRSRVAVLTEDRDGRTACAYLGRCLWGCPRDALYTPSITLAECRQYPNFTYVPGQYVSHLRANPRGRIVSAVATSVGTGVRRDIGADRFILAAGTLCSSHIYLRSILELTGETVTLSGLMDNRQILVPFLNTRLIGRTSEPDNYQYHQLAMGIEGATPTEYVHGQITTLKGALVHPIVHNVPLDLRSALALFRAVRAGLGVVNINLHDTRRADNYVTLERAAGDGPSRLVIHYEPAGGEPASIRHAVRTVKRALWKLGCIVPPGLTHVRPMGASVHYAGTLPMSAGEGPHRVSRACRSDAFENLYIVDGATMPFLPAKNLTFTLMANAVRVAAEAF